MTSCILVAWHIHFIIIVFYLHVLFIYLFILFTILEARKWINSLVCMVVLCAGVYILIFNKNIYCQRQNTAEIFFKRFISKLCTYSNPRLIRNWWWHIFISNLPNFEFTEFIVFMHNKGQWGKLISDKLHISILSLFFKVCWVLSLYPILHITCSLLNLLSTSGCVSFFWCRVAVGFCWFFYTFP